MANFNRSPKSNVGYRMLRWEEMIKSGDADTKAKGSNLIFVDKNDYVSPKVTTLFKAPSYTECSWIAWTVPQDDFEAINSIIRQLSFSGYVVVSQNYLPNGDLLAIYENEQGFLVSLLEISHRNLISFTLEKKQQ